MAAAEATYALVVGGDRLVPVDAEEARSIVTRLTVVVAENEGKTLTEVNLGCRTYREDGVAVLQDLFIPDLVKDVTTLKLDDMIAGVETDPALRMLQGICGMFGHCVLKSVDLSDNALGNRGLEACDSVLGQQNQLEKVKFEDNGLAAESMQVLEQQLAGSEHLTTLVFENNMVGPEGAVHFGQIVRSCPSLSVIKYAQVRAGLEGTRAVLQGIVDNTQLNLVSLNLNGGKLFSQDADDAIDLLGQALVQNATLTHLDIGDCELMDDGMNRVTPFLLEAGLSLESLNLSENELSPDCCNGIAEILGAQRPTLRSFHAYTNEFTSAGVEMLMGAYAEEGAVLEVIDLTDNQLGHRASVALERAQLSNLTYVKLSGNGFPLRDVTRLENRFGGALEELEDNDEDAEFDDELDEEEDEEIEEEVQEANANPQQPPQQDDAAVDDLVAQMGDLVADMGQNHTVA